jgi:transposase
MKKQRKHYTPEEKVAILRRHLLDKEPVSKLCDEIGLKPTVLYRWQKEFLASLASKVLRSRSFGDPIGASTRRDHRAHHRHAYST